MDSALSASDVAMLQNDGLGNGNSFLWIFALLILANGGFGNWGRNNGDYGAATQQEILFGQRFNSIDDKLDKGFTNVFNGIADSTFALNNAVKDGNYATQTAIKDCCCTTQRNTDALRYDMAQGFAATNANTTAQIQKVLDQMAQNKIDALQAEVSELKTQNMFCGIPRINPYGYGVYALPNNCGCNNNVI